MELDHESVYRLDPQPDSVGSGAWSITRMTFDTTAPNGLLLSPDNRTLYVAQSKYGDGQKRELRAYPILDDGSLGECQVLHNFYPHRGIDGMCLDRDGNLVATAGWEVSGPGAMIYVFAPNGRVLETHPAPANRPSNCTWGDADLRTLYVTTLEGHLLRARTDRQGLLLYPAQTG
jgi:gluconolactonase